MPPRPRGEPPVDHRRQARVGQCRRPSTGTAAPPRHRRPPGRRPASRRVGRTGAPGGSSPSTLASKNSGQPASRRRRATASSARQRDHSATGSRRGTPSGSSSRPSHRRKPPARPRSTQSVRAETSAASSATIPVEARTPSRFCLQSGMHCYRVDAIRARSGDRSRCPNRANDRDPSGSLKLFSEIEIRPGSRVAPGRPRSPADDDWHCPCEWLIRVVAVIGKTSRYFEGPEHRKGTTPLATSCRASASAASPPKGERDSLARPPARPFSRHRRALGTPRAPGPPSRPDRIAQVAMGEVVDRNDPIWPACSFPVPCPRPIGPAPPIAPTHHSRKRVETGKIAHFLDTSIRSNLRPGTGPVPGSWRHDRTGHGPATEDLDVASRRLVRTRTLAS